jgi:hypothetical protein
MDIFEVPPQVATLSECLLAIAAQERPLTSMFSEMVPQVAAFFKHTTTLRVHALKIQLNPLCLGVSNLDSLVPV